MNYGITPRNHYKVRTYGPGIRALRWAQRHESDGTYNYEGTLGASDAMWYFSNEDDAILFALKFK